MDDSLERTLGRVREVFRDESTVQFEWTIPHYRGCVSGYHFSPAVECFKTSWTFVIYMEGRKLHDFTLTRNPGIPESVLCTIRWKKRDGNERDITCDEMITTCGTLLTKYIIMLSGSDTFICTLRRHVSPHAPGISHETLTEGASCSNSRKDEHVSPGFRGVARETQTEDTGYKDTYSLSEHLKNLLISGDGNDVLIKVGEKQFRAHKHILKARSPVFAAMFTNDMAERTEDSFTIEDCDPDAFGDFLQFVYSGAVDIPSVGRALGLYYAADKYDFPKLKDMCVHFLKISFTTSTVFEVIQLATRHNEEELLQQAIVYFANNLEEVMLTVEWQRFITANPIQGNEMSLKAVQCLKSSLNKK